MKLIKGSILNKIQVAAEVNGALSKYDLVVVTKEAGPMYTVYACKGLLVEGRRAGALREQIHEFDDDRDTREEEGQQ